MRTSRAETNAKLRWRLGHRASSGYATPMMKHRSIRTLMMIAAVAALVAAMSCSNSDKAPAQTAPDTMTDAKLLALKFHHDA